MVKILPLTEEERRSAEIHHDWVYSFLHRHNYNIEEFYAIAVEGFLKGVQDWHRKPGTKEKWGMSIICERAIIHSNIELQKLINKLHTILDECADTEK